tara:strand:- start:53 stop:520 length:468 start_codon:yes stop_codon:yes gene_type:complete
MAFDNTVVGAPKGYGRTRRPKALWNDSVVSNKQNGTSVAMVGAASDLSATLTSVVAGQNGYSTENQKFLHVQIENNDANEDITIYVYNYAFGAWSPLYLDVQANNVNGSKAIATFSSVDGKKLFVLPIEGIDRVAFVNDGSVDANLVVRAACTSF